MACQGGEDIVKIAVQYDHSTRSPPPPPRLRRLLTASRCLRFHSRVSSPRAASHRARICVSSSVRANLTLTLRAWPPPFDVCGKKNGKVVSRELVLDCHVGPGVAAGRVVVMGSDVGTLAGQEPLLVEADSSKPRSKSSSSSESRSR